MDLHASIRKKPKGHEMIHENQATGAYECGRQSGRYSRLLATATGLAASALLFAGTAAAQTVRYEVLINTATQAEAESGEALWVRLTGTEGSTKWRRLGQGFARGQGNNFKFNAAESGIGDVGKLLYMDLRIGKGVSPADDWKYLSLKATRFVDNVEAGAVQLQEPGWLGDDITDQLMDRFYPAGFVTDNPVEVRTIVGERTYVFDNRGNSAPTDLEISDTYSLTSNAWNSSSQSRSNSYEVAVSFSKKVFGIESELKATGSGSATNESASGADSSVTNVNVVTEKFTVPANTLLVKTVTFTAAATKYTASYDGLKLVDWGPLPKNVSQSQRNVSFNAGDVLTADVSAQIAAGVQCSLSQSTCGM
tara:strand:- start:5556 stop:6650 length:1095 start_codon:yes stop_codon:yes gene_type:complete